MKEKLFPFFKRFILPKIKYASTSLIATILDLGLYKILVSVLEVDLTTSHIISYSCGMVFNFVLQRLFIFELKRKTVNAFGLAMMFSIIGLACSTYLIHWLTGYGWFAENYMVAKILVAGTIFFYNFYAKKFAFEKSIQM